MKKISKVIFLFVMLLVCVVFTKSDSKAEEEGIFLGEILALDSQGNIIAASGASVVTLSNGQEVCIGHTVAYSEGATYAFVFGENVEQVQLLEVYSEYGLLIFSVPSFCEGLPQGSAGGINNQTLLWELSLDAENIMTWIDCYLIGQSGFMWQVDSQGAAATPMLGGLVIDTTTRNAIGIIIDNKNNIFCDLDSLVNIMENGTANTSESTESPQTESPQTEAATEDGGQGTQTTESTPEESGGTGAGGGSDKSSVSYGFVVFIIVIVLIILALAVRKGNQENHNFEREYSGLDEINEGPISLECISGEHKGVVIPLDETIILGRDSEKCNLVFPGNTQGISGVHCKICRWDDNIELTDMGSTYGTYLEDGTKLSPNAPRMLKVGDGFYLADRKYFYRIK